MEVAYDFIFIVCNDTLTWKFVNHMSLYYIYTY